jgi:glycosyltransferase involved in cell wall biosynthesis
MPDCPKLAVIISCFNYESFVERAIRSVLSQASEDCELVVVDDGSTDGSWNAICRSDVVAYRIENGGQLAACLYGLDRTQAPFVLFLDADDELKPGSLATIIGLLDPAVAKLQFPLTLIDSNGNQIAGAYSSLETFRCRKTLVRQVLRTGVYKTPPTSGNVFRRDVCEILRDVSYDKAVDGVILFAAPFLGDVVSISDELGCYRIHGRNDSGLGRVPDAVSLERDIKRFVARMNHLHTVANQHGLGQVPVAANKAYYFRERKLYLDIASGHRPSLAGLPGLLQALFYEPFTQKNRIAMAAFFLIAFALPNHRAKALLAYRLQLGPRSAVGFVKRIFGTADI